jgi:hypothetical protein
LLPEDAVITLKLRTPFLLNKAKLLDFDRLQKLPIICIELNNFSGLVFKISGGAVGEYLKKWV